MTRRASHFNTFGRRFAVLAEFPDTDAGTREANAHMEAHSDAALLQIHEGVLYLADKNDRGQLVSGPYTEGPVFPA